MENISRKRIKMITCITFCILTLSACSQSKMKNEDIKNSEINSAHNSQESMESVWQNTENEVRTIPAQVSAQSGLLSVQAEVYVTEGVNLNTVPLGKAEVHLLDTDMICEDLSYGVDVEDKVEYEKEHGNEDLDSFISRTFYYEDGRILVIEPLYLSYITPKSRSIDKVVLDEEGASFNNMEVYKDKELPFARSEDVYEEVKCSLEQWGVLIGEKHELFGLDYETMKEQEYVINEAGEYNAPLKKESWTEEDDCYYFQCAQEFHGIPIYYYGYGVLRGYHNIGPAFKVKYDRDGFVEITIERPYDVQDTGKTVSIISAEDAVDCLIRKFDNIIMTDPVVVDKLSLQMLPQRTTPGSYDLIPVWIFEGKEYWTLDDGTEAVVSDKYMFDAETGKEIIL